MGWKEEEDIYGNFFIVESKNAERIKWKRSFKLLNHILSYLSENTLTYNIINFKTPKKFKMK